ncbi:MAG: heparinase II/III family protein [Reichenbachiella sp.]
MKSISLVGFRVLLLFCSLIWVSSCGQGQNTTVLSKRESMVFKSGSIADIQQNAAVYPLFAITLKNAIEEVDAEIALEMDVPVPKDLAGGYTHNKHKRNYTMMQKAGKLYKITKDDKYAQYVETMLLKYAELFPTLGLHPVEKSYTRGKLFWQCLNDANWLVYSSQAYDCVYDYMEPSKRDLVEKDLFRPYADFLSVETPHFFNRIHNHSTWACAGVGMIGLVMNDSVLVNRALYGLEDDGLNKEALDNDGGLIKSEEKAGFLSQMDLLFSPDGFYAEGPYYQRYAIYPFIVFAASLENLRPDLKIFEHRDGILGKAVVALLNLTDDDGEFYPINDSQKGMSYYSKELVSAVDIAYTYSGNEAQLLSIANKQGKVLLDGMGFQVAKDLSLGKEEAFLPSSMELRDGANGDEGGIGILRSTQNDANINVVFKYTAQGMGHGHYDKLAISMFKNGEEVLQDYGVARYVNIEQKDGGGYLKENKTFAKQTIAHNTLVVNEKTNFNAKIKVANKQHSDRHFFDVSNPSFQVASAKESNAYAGVKLQRTLCVIKDEAFNAPVVLDIMKVIAENENQYDLPYYYFGQPMSTNFEYSTPDMLPVLGDKNGYQHIRNEAISEDLPSVSQFTWLNNDQFYTLSSVTKSDDEVSLNRIGANDPNFNLRRDPIIMLRRSSKNTLFVSTIESHGSYSRVSELSDEAFSQVENLEVLFDGEESTVVELTTNTGVTMVICITNGNGGKDVKHEVNIGSDLVKWVGPYYYKTLKN